MCMSYGMGSPTGVRGPTGGNRGLPKQKIGGRNVESLQQFTPEQMQLFQSMFSNVGPDSFTGRLAGGDQEAFNQIEAPAHRDFSATLGGIASRFSEGGGGPGSMSSRRSSGFKNTATAAASNFAQDLQSRRTSLQQNAIKELMGMSSELLGQRPYEQFAVEPNKKKSFWEQLIGAGLPLAGAGAGFALGGPAGAVAGGQIGRSASQGFFA